MLLLHVCNAVEEQEDCFTVSEERVEHIAAERLKRECVQESREFNGGKSFAAGILRSAYLQEYGLESEAEDDYNEDEDVEQTMENEYEKADKEVEKEGTSDQGSEVDES